MFNKDINPVDLRIRRTISSKSKEEDSDLVRHTKLLLDEDEDLISPYVIVNNTDLSVVVKRIVKKKETQNQDFLMSMVKPKESEIEQVEPMGAGASQGTSSMIMFNDERLKRKKTIKSVYKISQGQIVDHLIDQNDLNYKLDSMVDNREDFAFSPGQNDEIYNKYMDEIIHQDHIGEYKREIIKI